ncbi:hypothetical protein EYF80_040997 [Liparis tanakae]|uniref:Uncharacterized protein n=1 Tax=Liparis tanakae TaxID=230148 RepID=A0A4Z2G8B4_9TELE|nr:hypothetical protein EYF80_040997 [Liparis tanakae]
MSCQCCGSGLGSPVRLGSVLSADDLEPLIPGAATGGRGQRPEGLRAPANQRAAGGVHNVTVISVDYCCSSTQYEYPELTPLGAASPSRHSSCKRRGGRARGVHRRIGPGGIGVTAVRQISRTSSCLLRILRTVISGEFLSSQLASLPPLMEGGQRQGSWRTTTGPRTLLTTRLRAVPSSGGPTSHCVVDFVPVST